MDGASRMECRNCKKILNIEEFYEHIMNAKKEECEFCEIQNMGETIDRLEFEKIKLELSKTRESLQKLEETKKETENSLKAEIKFLITKLMKKTGLDQTSEKTPENRPFRSISSNIQCESRNAGTIKTARESKNLNSHYVRSTMDVDTEKTMKKSPLKSYNSPNSTFKNVIVKVTQENSRPKSRVKSVPRITVTGRYKKKVDLEESDITEGTITRTDENIFLEENEGKNLPMRMSVARATGKIKNIY